MTAPTTTPTLDVNALRSAPDSFGALLATLADEIEWIDVYDHERRVYHGRDAAEAMLRDVEASGIVSTVVDGFASGDRAALTVHCALPDGGVLVTNALLHLRAGRIARW